MDCLFCDYTDAAKHQIIAENNLAYARWDNFPASLGHLEVVPKRHVVSFFDLKQTEILALYALISEAKKQVDERYVPAGYNIGINDGEAAGRTIHHLHIHLIPRYQNDVENPRGGVRHIIPGKGNY